MTRLRTVASSSAARLAIGYVLVAAVFAAAWLWSLYGPLTDAALRQQQRNLTAVAQSGALVAAQSPETPQRIAKQLVARTDLRLTIVAADGHVIADSNFDPGAMENHADRPEIARALSGEIGTARRVSDTAGIEELYVAVPASLAGARVALRVSQPLSEIEAVAARSRRIGLLLLGLALAIAAGIAAWAARQAAMPVRALSEAAERMAGGDLSSEVPAVPRDLEGLAAALTDLRSQMRARLDALEAEKLTLRSTLDGLTDAVLVLDGQTIRLANAAAGALFSTPPGGWDGVLLADAGLPGPVDAAVRTRLRAPDPTAFELEPDPTGRTLRMLVAPLDAGAETGRSIVVIADVTERAHVERMRRDFVANASHELKTPVAGIRLLAESAQAAASDGDAEQALAFTRGIEAETARLQRLVRDLLDLSRLETTPAADEIVDVRVAVDRAVVSHRAAAGRKDLRLEVDWSAVRSEDVFARVDSTDLAIALDNLLDNAIAYTVNGGIAITVTGEERAVRISVSDSGPGIAPEHQPRVFERFYRIDAGRSREAGGTGLGLALVRHVVERSGGSVSLRSVPGEGSTFTLVLPRAV